MTSDGSAVPPHRLSAHDPRRPAHLVDRWLQELPHLSESAKTNHRQLRRLEDLSVPCMHAWLVGPKLNGQKPSNNYVRDRLASLRSFVTWLIDNEQLPPAYDRTIDWAHFRREYPRVYGKRQSAHPARFLTYDQAYNHLVRACQDGTPIGIRDEVAIRLGLLGLRRAEVVGPSWGNYQHGVIRTTGKRHRIREVRPGPQLVTLLALWQRLYEDGIGRHVEATDPLLCATARGLYTHGAKPAPAIAWGDPLGYTAFFDLVQHRATQATLGHVTPHDLRRTAATILYNARSAEGAHLYDLLDIQRVLDHTSPDTTQRSYLDHLDTSVKTRAGADLD